MTISSRGGARPNSGTLSKSAYVVSGSLSLPDPSQYQLPQEFMLKHMNDPNLTLELRIRIAQALLPYYAVQQRHIGKKERKQELADVMSDDRFVARRTPTRPAFDIHRVVS